MKSFVKKVLHERLLLTVLVASRLLRLPLLFHVCFQTLTSQVVANLEKGGQKVCVALFTFVLQLSEIFPFILLTSLPLPFKVLVLAVSGRFLSTGWEIHVFLCNSLALLSSPNMAMSSLKDRKPDGKCQNVKLKLMGKLSKKDIYSCVSLHSCQSILCITFHSVVINLV